jgi:hypothetical protein
MAYCTCPGWLWWWRIWWNEDWQGRPKYSEKTCPNATLSTTNPTWPDTGANPGSRGGKPATNRLSYGVAHYILSSCPFSVARICRRFTPFLCLFDSKYTVLRNAMNFLEEKFLNNGLSILCSYLYMKKLPKNCALEETSLTCKEQK